MPKKQEKTKLTSLDEEKELQLGSTLFPGVTTTWEPKNTTLGQNTAHDSFGAALGNSLKEADDVSTDDEAAGIKYTTNYESDDEEDEKDSNDNDSDSDEELKPEEPESRKRKPAWVDEDDDNTKVADALLARARKVPRKQMGTIKAVRDDNYQELLRRKFVAAVGPAPDWADLTRSRKKKSKGVENDEYQQQLKEKFLAKGLPVPAWATLQDSDEDEDAIKIDSSNLLNKMSGIGSLAPDNLDFRWTSDINTDDAMLKNQGYQKMHGNVRAVYATNYPVALVTKSGLKAKGNGFASLFQVGADKSHSLDHIFFKTFPISTSAFLPGEKKFVIGAEKRNYFYLYDMQASKETRIPWMNSTKGARDMKGISVLNENEVLVQEVAEMTIVDTRSWRPVYTLRGHGPVGTHTVSAHGDTIYSFEKDSAKVFVWDVRTRRARNSFLDDGCIHGTVLAASPNNQYLACGSNTGIVNVYRTRDVEASKQPKPVKMFQNLVTSVSSLHFNNTSEMLVFSSDELPVAIKIAHFPSMRVFSNFPPASGKNLWKVKSCSFSPKSGYLNFTTVGRDARVRRFRLFHYGQW